jgi:hypothetical protein|tara:strand:- start:332 stop:2023 length:1692 start_codon:yes stop_codon:yes gene_type:complete
MTQQVAKEKGLKAALTGKGSFDSRNLEDIFEKCRHSEAKMLQLVRGFCQTYLIDNKQRPLKLRPLQEEIIVKSLTYPKGGKQRKLAILAPRGSGKSYALAVAVTIYMFFKRFRDLIFVLAPSEDQAALIFNYVYRNFKDNAFLDSLVDNYRFHNKPNITLKGGTVMRRAPLAPTNQGQAIRGQHPTMCIVDESPLIDDRLFVDNVEPAIVSNKAPFINLGTPKSKENHMYRYLYDEAYENSFTRLHFTWRDAIKPGDAYTAPYTELEMLDKMTEWGEDSIYWKTEYECEFVESVSNIFTPEKLKDCFDDYRPWTRDTLGEGGDFPSNITVGVDVGKSINSTVITGWTREKSMGPDNSEDYARLVYIEEISPRSGGHDIPYQRKRIIDVCRLLGADKLIVDCTGIGGAIEQDLRMECINSSPQINFIPFIFTGGPRGTKTQIYRDYVSYIQQKRIKVPNPEHLPASHKKLVLKWYAEHRDLEYTMDASNKTEKISAPSGKHDDYCDSSVMGIHGTLSVLPGSATFTSTNRGSSRRLHTEPKTYSKGGLFTTRGRNHRVNKGFPL